MSVVLCKQRGAHGVMKSPIHRYCSLHYLCMLASIIIASTRDVSSKHVVETSGFRGSTNFEFLTRFCYENGGTLEFELLYPQSECCSNLLFYYDAPDVWERVKNDGGTCEERQNVAINQGNYRYLRPGFFLCELRDDDRSVYCHGKVNITQTYHRWWFFTLSNCNRPTVNLAYYNFTMHNKPGVFTKEFSADEFGILQTDIGFLCLYSILTIQCYVVAQALANRRLLHTSYRLYATSVLFAFISLIFDTAHYGRYSTDGVGVPVLKSLGEFLEFLQFSMFLILLVLLAKGWTVTRGVIEQYTAVKLVIFFLLYFIAALVMVIWYASSDTREEVLYIYASPPGYGLVGIFFATYLWFCYATFFSIKNHKNRRPFFQAFFALFTPWFLLTPVTILVLARAVEDYQRQKIVHGLQWGIAGYGHLVFAVITFPDHYSETFPYHIKTNQIGAIETTQGALETAYTVPSSGDGEDAADGADTRAARSISRVHTVNKSLFVMDVGDDGDIGETMLDSKVSTESTDSGVVANMMVDGDVGTSIASDHNSSCRNLLQHVGTWVTETGLAEPATMSNSWGKTAHTLTATEETNLDAVVSDETAPEFQPSTPRRPETSHSARGDIPMQTLVAGKRKRSSHGGCDLRAQETQNSAEDSVNEMQDIHFDGADVPPSRKLSDNSWVKPDTKGIGTRHPRTSHSTGKGYAPLLALETRDSSSSGRRVKAARRKARKARHGDDENELSEENIVRKGSPLPRMGGGHQKGKMEPLALQLDSSHSIGTPPARIYNATDGTTSSIASIFSPRSSGAAIISVP